MALEVKMKLYGKLQSAMRLSMVHCLSGVLPLYIVNEYPKSGGTWVGQMLERGLHIPFPRNRFPLFGKSIIHGHYFSPWGMKNVVVIWRDGRDIMVSWYHHCFFKNELGNEPLVNIIRKDLPFKDYENVLENLPKFIEYSFSRRRHPSFSWSEFVRRWYGRNEVTYVRYEDLRHNTVSELQRIILDLTGERLGTQKATEIANELSFERLTGRRAGQEKKDSFLRKGIVGDWRNYFNMESSELFDFYAGNELILLGYEKDSSWVVSKYIQQ